MKRLLVLLLWAAPAFAHVGSLGVFHEGPAGPYRLLVSITPPRVIPGVAEVEVKSEGAEMDELSLTPLPLDGKGAALAPTADRALRSKEDPRLFTANLWLMTAGSWQVRFEAKGKAGTGTLSVPVPALPERTKGMPVGLAMLLSALGLALALGLVAIAGAATREATLPEGALPDARAIRRGRVAMFVGAIAIGSVVLLGSKWWDAEAGDYARYVYKPLSLATRLEGGSLSLSLQDPGWLPGRKVDDLLLDHGHPMHLFVLRLPEMDRVFHLHPEPLGKGDFSVKLPPMPEGRYRLFGDIVHESGLAETAVADVSLPAIAGSPLTGDDSAGEGPALSAADGSRPSSPLSEGAQMLLQRDGSGLVAKKPALLRFSLATNTGKPVDDLEPYMGMLGHAAIVKRDLSVFAHVHPTGSVPMAALALANPGAPLPGHVMSAEGLPSEVSFPFGFPSGGDYRIFVQVKRSGRVETGVFDVKVADAPSRN